jgi:glycyl-tRNA synthetase
MLQGTEYCYVTTEVGGETASGVLQSALPEMINRLSFGRSMRWMPHSEVTFSRPVRWLLALHGDVPVPVTLGSLHGSQQTRLLRQSQPPVVDVASVEEYRQALANAGIVLGQDERQAQIWSAVQDAAKVWHMCGEHQMDDYM